MNQSFPETNQGTESINMKERDTLLSVLHEIQHAYKGKTWINSEDLFTVAQRFGIPIAELDGVISFYTMFSRIRRGRHIIRLCDSLSCRICGSLDIYRHIRNKFGISRGMTTKDGIFTLEIVNCLGACSTSPNIMIDDQLLSGVSVADLDDLFDQIVKEEK